MKFVGTPHELSCMSAAWLIGYLENKKGAAYREIFNALQSVVYTHSQYETHYATTRTVAVFLSPKASELFYEVCRETDEARYMSGSY